jgi:hypothetical protein
MATSYTGKVSISFNGVLTKDTDLGSLTYSITYPIRKTMVNGTESGAANMVWTDTRTISASSSESLDLAGSLANAFGDTITFTKIKQIIITASSSNTNNVVIGGAGSNAWSPMFGDATDKLVINPGYTFSLGGSDAAGYAVTAGTGDILLVANSSSGSSVTYDIIIEGTV